MARPLRKALPINDALIPIVTRSPYFQQQCAAASLLEVAALAIDLDNVGGLFGHPVSAAATSGGGTTSWIGARPTPFVCLLFRLLLDPNVEMVERAAQTMLRQPHHKYMRALALVYLRIAGRPLTAHQALDVAFCDHRRVRIMDVDGTTRVVCLDQLADTLMQDSTFCALALPVLPSRSNMCRSLLANVKCDVCIIGSGPAGIAAAMRAVDFNKSVCIVEKNGRLGGADLWNGALQSKAMWEMSKFCAMMRGRTSQRVLEFDSAPQPSFDRILETLNAQATAREQQLIRQLEAARVRVMQGTAMFSNARQVEVMSDAGEFATIQADYYVIATGSKPREHPQYRFDGQTIMSSDQLLLKPFPKSIVIIGAGAIGCEFASMLANFGQTKVNMIEKGRRILPLEDDDVAFKIQLLLENKGVRFHHESALRSLNLVDGGVRYTVKNSVTGEMSVLNVEKALVSIGRQPNYASLGLENVPGIRIENGRISKDRFGRVEPYRHIYVAGDASGGAGLVNAAEMQARGCVEHMFSFKPQSGDRFNASNLTTILFLDQEVASVGWNERLCQQNAVAYRMARYGYEFVSRALAMNNTNGFIKIIVTNDHEQRVLGVRAVGPHASSVVEIAAHAVHHQKTLAELSELFVAYPAITQGFQECVRMLLGTSTLKPNVFPQLVVHEWSPTLPRGRGYPNTTGNMQ